MGEVTTTYDLVILAQSVTGYALAVIVLLALAVMAWRMR